MTGIRQSGGSAVVSKPDFLGLHELSVRLKAVREPVRELARVATSAPRNPAPSSAALLARVYEQIDQTQQVLFEYLASVAGIADDHPALARYQVSQLSESTRTSQSNESTRTSQSKEPARTSQSSESARSRSSTQNSQDSTLQTHKSTRTSHDSTHKSSHKATRPTSLFVPPYLLAALGDTPETPTPMSPMHPITPNTANTRAVVRTVSSMWQHTDTQPARAVNEEGVQLGPRHMAALEERIPATPMRTLDSDTPVDVIDLVNSMLRMHNSSSSSEASLLTRLETIPPGIVACAIANSTGQLFEHVTADVVAAYVRGDDAPALRRLSDHANFLTRLMEVTIAHPAQAAQRARRIEWWAVTACLVRELGDYEAASSLACAFSGAAVTRLADAWAQVAAPCRAAIRFLQDHVLKIVPNYACYRAELRMRMRRVSSAPKRSEPTGADESLDFDSAVAISTPDLCAADDSYVTSAVFSKDAADLPPPRMLVPIVAVLLKDAVSDGVSRTPRLVRAPPEPTLHWTCVLDACRPAAPLPLDYYLLRRVFATEPVLLLTPTQSLARGAMSTASSFLRRMPLRHSSDRDEPKELSLAPCRLLESPAAPTVVDVLAHLLLIAAGTPCYSCRMGSLLAPLHVTASAQLAVAASALMLFSEPWMPREFLMRLCDMREPRAPKPHSALSPPLPTANTMPLTANHTPSLHTANHTPLATHSLGSETRSTERPWLMSFKLTDSTDSARYFRARSTLPPPRDAEPESESARKSSTDSDSTCVNRLPSPPQPTRQGRFHSRSLSSHAALPVAVSPSPFDLPPLPSHMHSPPLPSNIASLHLSPPPLPTMEMPSQMLPPPLPSVEMPSQALPPPPPLPTMEMPTWLPSSWEPTQPSVFNSLPSNTLDQPQNNLIPPLPSLPMPRFQPPSAPAVSLPLVPQPSQMPHIFNHLPLSNTKMEQLDGISAETQMLLSFDTRTRKR
ncbi:hypothetical protein GGF49_001238 [Coemansia sp. RSA 1853]|nr:hypothetical protein GGF49_001238 [Coemansia sp. RSA 1853]